MKKLLLMGAALAATATALWAPPHYGYVGNRGGATVSVFDSNTGAPFVLPPPANPINVGAGPTGVLAVQLLNRVYVTNAGSGTVSVIDGDLLDVVNTIPLAGATALGGLCLSEDRQSLFVAGRNAGAGQAGIWRIDLLAETSTYLGGVALAATAVDCDVIRAAQVGGTGDAPGKVYFTIPGANQVGIYDALSSTFLTPLAVTAVAVTATTPTGIERAPDHSFLLCGVASTDGVNQRIARIIPGAGAGTDTIATLSMGAVLGPPRTTNDIVFRFGVGPVFQAYVYGEELNTISRYVYDITISSTALGPPPPAGRQLNSNNLGFAISYDVIDDVLWVGAQTGADNQIQGLDASVSPPAVVAPALTLTTGAGPGKVDFLLQPKRPSISVACPKGEVIGPSSRIVVRGSEFRPNSVVRLGAGAGVNSIPTTFLNQNTLIGDTSGVTGSALFDVYVRNRDLQSARLNSYYQSIVGAPATPAFTVNLPPFAAGYEMKSFPQYGSIADLQQALLAQLGPYNPVFYRVFLWYQDHYEELNQLSNGIDPCDLSGRAFFVLTRFGRMLTLSAPDVAMNASGTVNVIPLTQGWNMISQPWLRGATNTIPWAQVQVSLNSDLSNPLPAPGPGWLSPLPYERLNHQYLNVTALTAGRGYWVHNYTPGPAYLIIDNVFVSKPGDPAPAYTALAAGDPGPPPPPSDVMAASGGSSGGGGCGFLGPELLLVALAFHRLTRRRRLGA